MIDDLFLTQLHCCKGGDMRSKITSKYQITLPKEIRQRLNVDVSDILEWHLTPHGVLVEPAKRPFLEFAGAINVGKGDVVADLKRARQRMAERYSER